MTRRFSGTRLCLGLAAALAYLLLTVPFLDSVGLYYDEAYQAPAAFSYVGKNPRMFTPLSVGGVPLLTGSYVGAIKSGLYGLYLKCTSRPFTIESWRMTGILLTAFGFVVFSAATAGTLSAGALCLFFALMLTDVDVLLATRHDYSPVSISLFLRMLFLAAWILPRTGEASERRRAAFMGALVGLAIYDKATGIVLLPALLIRLATGSRRTDRGCWLAALGGLSAGLLPLAGANLRAYWTGRGLIALDPISRPWRGLPGWSESFSFVRDFLGLGQGAGAAGWILGVHRTNVPADVEAALIAALLGAVLYEGRRGGRRPHDSDAPGLAAAYLCTGAALLFLPYATEFPHWTMATPLQYLAIALWSQGDSPPGGASGRRPRVAALLPVALLLTRLPALAAAEKAMRAGKTGVAWDRSFSTLAEFAAKNRSRAVFVAADWGFAAQIYCASQAEDGVVFEPFWDYRGPRDLKPIFDAANGKKDIYVLVRKFRPPLKPEATAAILADMARAPGWVRSDADEELSSSRAFEVVKYSFVPGRTR